MKKSEEILEKHIVLNDCIGYLGSDGRLYKAIIDALNEAINYTHSCKSDSEQLVCYTCKCTKGNAPKGDNFCNMCDHYF